MTVMTGGFHLSEGERGVRSWAGSGVSWAGWLPGSAQLGWLASSFYFFLLLPFSLLFLISVLCLEGVLPFKIE
jgi:hypothetical protein